MLLFTRTSCGCGIRFRNKPPGRVAYANLSPNVSRIYLPIERYQPNPTSSLQRNPMKQQSLTDGFDKYRKSTCKEQFLKVMETIISWPGLVDPIAPCYPRPEGAGRRPIGIERCRVSISSSIGSISPIRLPTRRSTDSRAVRQFVGADLGNEPASDERLAHRVHAHLANTRARSWFLRSSNTQLPRILLTRA